MMEDTRIRGSKLLARGCFKVNVGPGRQDLSRADDCASGSAIPDLSSNKLLSPKPTA